MKYWFCPICDYGNPISSDVCLECGEPKPETSLSNAQKNGINYVLSNCYLNGEAIKGSEALGILLLIAGILIMLAMFGFFLVGLTSRSARFLIFGIISCLVGIFVLIFAFDRLGKGAQYVTDEEYDENVAHLCDNISENAENAFSVNENQRMEMEPIIFSSYCYPPINGKVIYKRGRDEIVRSNIFMTVYMMFFEQEIYVYKIVSYTDKNISNEETYTIFYDDIVSVTTTSEMVNYAGQSNEITVFSINTILGTAIEFALADKENAQYYTNIIRALIRKKKQG